MKPFVYVRAADEGAAIRASSAPDSQFIAGGTSVVDLMRLGVTAPAQLVDVNGLAWAKIEPGEGGGLRVGAFVKNSDLAHHADVKASYAALSEALLSGASPQLRNMASVGGNLLQRTRCSYFRDVGVPDCNKRAPGSGCAARDGHSRMHAILGGSPQCIAVNPSDMCVALLAFDAVIHVRGADGERTIRMADLHTLPGAHPEIETTLRPGELITFVELPKPASGVRSAYVKVRDRASYAFALASAAVALEVAGGTVKSVRIALGGVGTKPWRSEAAEAVATGKAPTTATWKEAAAAAVSGAETRPENAFKVALIQRVIVRALERAGGAT